MGVILKKVNYDSKWCNGYNIALETKLVGKYEITAPYFSINVIILCIEQIERNE